MLKTSPILTSSANASPTSFRRGHATPPSPQASPRLTSSTSTARLRQSATTTSPKATSNSPRRLHAKPTESAIDGRVQHDGVNSRQEINQLSPSPHPQAQARPQHIVTPAASGSLPSGSPAHPQPSTGSDNEAQKLLSPNKRRVSPGGPSDDTPATSQTGERIGGRAPSSAITTAPKRARTSGEPKILPQRYELCAVEDIVELIAHMLAELIATNDAIRISSGGLTRFHSRTAPGISVRDYLHRLARHATLTPPLLLSMVYYIDRLCALYAEFTINTLTVHRFLITAATVAAKGLSDSFWNNTTYARVGGVRVAELKMLELEFLYRVDWKIVPNPEVLVAYYRGLVERTPQYALESDGSSDDSSIGDDEDVGEEEERRQQKEEIQTWQE
ncbi:Pho80p cyclin [Metarhizium acridum]|uniref:Nuc-1 negative regulatory protein preg n=1 Tax=Metarhizium acridum (strain CQMa 102) TaxID=655827 RepID=E9DRW4_METAQ|nr:Nuc-1 negative regulatory protein preg [Metarhizium acridum CQMa 102]EFY93546.1 Nuc-1 negative regulatory protein preg [Metarhizium acridum CQMa 102]KAG8423202.1 Pho80p cyclin [Metarhizium acridum]